MISDGRVMEWVGAPVKGFVDGRGGCRGEVGEKLCCFIFDFASGIP